MIQIKIKTLKLAEDHLNKLNYRLNQLFKHYVQLCDELDFSFIGEKNLKEKTTEMTIILSMMEDLDNNIKNINKLVEELRAEILN